MRGSIRPWGEDLAADLGRLTGSFTLILIGPGPVAVLAGCDAAQQAAHIHEARERWGSEFLFHLFSPEVEYRWDHGVGLELSLGPEGRYDATRRECFLAVDPARVPGIKAFGPLAPGGRMRIVEFTHDGRSVDFKLEALV
ncbi:MAG: hypothetical protein HY815_01835 [Candidatus Riflebacteria bacterium]|nr:hypothetical protein [Candidatus Riflebacteria bacterium]